MKFDETISLYHHDPLQSGETSAFTRLVYIDDYGTVPPYEIAITVEMRWNSGAVPRSFTIRHNMLNWQE
jgi:hypothetical protein